MRLTLKTINKELAKHGPERLVRGDGYFYFVDGNAFRWHSGHSVYVHNLNQMTLEQWVKLRNTLATEDNLMSGL